MKDYKKPMIVSMGTSEGVYLASGETCYTAYCTVDQYDTQQKRFHVYITHDTTALDGHHSHGQTIVVTFGNTPTNVTFVEGGQVDRWEFSGNTLTIYASRHLNGNSNAETTSFNFDCYFSDVPNGVAPSTPTAVCYDTAKHKSDHSDF